MAEYPSLEPVLAGVDRDVGAHAGAQYVGALLVDPDPDRNALHDLDPVAGRVLRRKQGKFRAGRRADRGDLAFELEARIGVDRHHGFLPGADVGELGFLEIGLDPGITRLDERKHLGAFRDVLADIELVDLADNAVLGRANRRAREVERGLLLRRQRRLHGGVRIDRRVGIAVERRRRRVDRFLRQLHLRIGLLRSKPALVERRRRGEALPGQFRRTGKLAMPYLGSRLVGFQLRFGGFIGGLQLLDVEPGLGQRRVGLVDGDPERLGIDLEEHVASLDLLVLFDVHLDDLAGDIRRDRRHRLLHIGVVGLDVASARQPEIGAARRQKQRHAEHQHQAQQPALALLRRQGGLRHGRLDVGRHFYTRIHATSSSRTAMALDRLEFILLRAATNRSRSSSSKPAKASS
jgi:hypothetical protein